MPDPKKRPTLKFGSTDPHVAELVTLLKKHGCAPRPPVTSATPRFGVAIENMVLYFQMTHQGKNGDWLDVDGIVGKGTWWALDNASGDAQRSFLEVALPEGLTEERRKLLEIAVSQHGIREDPKLPPNRGKEVDKFQPGFIRNSTTKEGQAWCSLFCSWVIKEHFGRHVMGRPVAGVWDARNHAVDRGRWEPNDGRIPTPGDAFVILHSDDFEEKRSKGHIGFVLMVSEDGKSINTIEGNCGNRVKIAKRNLSDPRLRGFINIFGDHPTFKRGELRGAKNAGKSTTR